MLADSGMRHLAPHARRRYRAITSSPSKRIFDNSKVSDHFAIIPTLQAPSGLSDAEQKLYDLVARRFMAVFFPSAEYMVTTSISTVRAPCFQNRRQGTGQARLARHLRQGSRRRSGRRQRRRQGPEPGTRRSWRKAPYQPGRPQGPEDPPPSTLQRSHAAGCHGRRWQDRRRRRTARSHARKRPGHASHPRRHHRGPDQRKIPACAKAAR
jgi:hypothetical protein